MPDSRGCLGWGRNSISDLLREGFFDACCEHGLTRDQRVVIPTVNVLRHDENRSGFALAAGEPEAVRQAG